MDRLERWFGIASLVCAALAWAMFATRDDRAPAVERAAAGTSMAQTSRPSGLGPPATPSPAPRAHRVLAATRPTAPVARAFESELRDLSRLEGEQLLALYEAGLASSSPEARYLGYRAWDLCAQAVMPDLRVDVEHVAIEGEAQRRRLVDARRLHELRCAPFYRHRREHLWRDGARMGRALFDESAFGRLPALPDPKSGAAGGRGAATSYGTIDRSGEPAAQVWADRLRHEIDRYGAAVLDWRDIELSTWLERAGPRAGDPSDPAVRDALRASSVLLAKCHAGFDCRATSLEYLRACGQFGLCDEDMAGFALRDVPPDRRDQAEREARRLAQALERRDFRALGL